MTAEKTSASSASVLLRVSVHMCKNACRCPFRGTKPLWARQLSALVSPFAVQKQPANSNQCNSGRHLFKLSKIQLKSDQTGKDVQPIIEDAYSEEPSASPRKSMDASEDVPATAKVKSDMRSTSDGHVPLPERPEHHHSHRDVPAGSAASQAPPPNSTPDSASHAMQPSSRGSIPAHINGDERYNFSPEHLMHIIDTKLEAVDRLRDQVNFDRAGLDGQNREIHSLREAFAAMQHDMRRMGDMIECLKRELYSRPPVPPPPPPLPLPPPPPPRGEIPDETLEAFSSQLQSAIRKANEIDELKVQLEVLKRKVARAPATDASPATGMPYSAQRETPVHSTPISQHTLPPVVPHLAMPRPPQPPQSAYLHPYTPEVPPRPIESELQSSGAAGGWTSVNTNAKRGYPNGTDANSEAGDTPLGSPKRQKLAPIEPRQAHEVAASSQPIPPERMDVDEVIHQTRSRTQQAHPDSTTPSNFQTYPIVQQADQEEKWRQEPQRVVSNPPPDIHRSPRGRPRGRGGRPRKSLPIESHNPSAQEWDKDGWAASQVVRDDFYPSANPATAKRGGLIRRSSVDAPPSNRIAIPPPVPTQATAISILDPYAQTKKTRTKPVRNAEGILIRKDGRPDMRSQSSAANLRKVHARKEEEKRLEAEAARGAATAASSPQTPASNEGDSQHHGDRHDAEEDNAPDMQERTEKILNRMFPRGTGEQKAKLATADTYFPKNGKTSPDRAESEAREASAERQSEKSHERIAIETTKESTATAAA